MEDTLRDDITAMLAARSGSLNPCFNGRYSQSKPFTYNPPKVHYVLILVLMEDTLRGMRLTPPYMKMKVLILVLMEDTLREMAELWLRLSHYCLNPCFNGRYSQSSY